MWKVCWIHLPNLLAFLVNVLVEGAVVTQVDAQTRDMRGRLYLVNGGVKGDVLYDVFLFSTLKQLKLLIFERHVVSGPGLVVADRHPQLWIQSC